MSAIGVEAADAARAALLAALDPEDETLRQVVGDAYREGMRAFLENMHGDSIGAINDAMQDAGARAAIAALRTAAQGVRLANASPADAARGDPKA